MAGRGFVEILSHVCALAPEVLKALAAIAQPRRWTGFGAVSAGRLVDLGPSARSADLAGSCVRQPDPVDTAACDVSGCAARSGGRHRCHR